MNIAPTTSFEEICLSNFYATVQKNMGFMYLSAQHAAFGASSPASVSSDIPLLSGAWRLSLKSISLREVWGEALV